MTVRSVFYTAGGTLRAPWRIVIFVAVLALCMVAAALMGAPLLARLFRLAHLGIAVDGWAMLAAVIAAHLIMLRRFDRRPWSFVNLDRAAAEPARLLHGFLLGAVAIALPLAVLVATGWLRRFSSAGSDWIGAAFRVSIYLLPAALLEELVTRGYVFSVIRESAGVWWALGTTSVVFGALHAANPGATPASIAAVTLAGVFLGAVVIALRSLYAAWMAHFAWNWALAVVFHALVSGQRMESPIYRYLDSGPDWATGGVWGPEGGAGAVLGMLGGLVYLYARRRRAFVGDVGPAGAVHVPGQPPA